MDTLRSAIQPLTHNLPEPIRELGLSLIGDKCYKALVLDVDVENTECLKLAVSKAIGIGIVGASSVVKVPQIAKLIHSKSASGVSFLSYLLETSSLLITLAYNVRNGFPFSTFGETALILGQNVIITVLVLNYSGRATMAALLVAALAASVVTLFSDNLLDMSQLGYLQAGAGVLGVASKIPQITAIFQEGSTGQLSAAAVRTIGCPYLVSAYRDTNVFLSVTGLQLSLRLAVTHLHNPSGGRRQEDSVRLYCRLRSECRPRATDDLLLERALSKGKGQAKGGACPSSITLCDHDGDHDLHADKEGPNYPSSRLDWCPFCVLLSFYWGFFFLDRPRPALVYSGSSTI